MEDPGMDDRHPALKHMLKKVKEERDEEKLELPLSSPITETDLPPEKHPIKDARRVWEVILENWHDWVADAIEISGEKALRLPIDRIEQASKVGAKAAPKIEDRTKLPDDEEEANEWKYELTRERAEKGICLLIALRHLVPVDYETAMNNKGEDKLHPTGSKEPFAPYMIVRSSPLPEERFYQLVEMLSVLPAPIKPIHCQALARKADNLDEFREFCEVLFQICRKQSQIFHKDTPKELKRRTNPS